MTTRPNEINDRDMMPRLASRTKAMAEHEPQGRPKHGLVGLSSKARILWAGASFLSALARKRSICAPVNFVRLELLHAAPTSETRLLCQRFSRKASFRARRDLNS